MARPWVSVFLVGLAIAAPARADVAPLPFEDLTVEVLEGPSVRDSTLTARVRLTNAREAAFMARIDGYATFRGQGQAATGQVIGVRVGERDVGFEDLPQGPRTRRFSRAWRLGAGERADVRLRIEVPSPVPADYEIEVMAHAVEPDGSVWLGAATIHLDDEARPAERGSLFGCAVGRSAPSPAGLLLAVAPLALWFRRRRSPVTTSRWR